MNTLQFSCITIRLFAVYNIYYFIQNDLFYLVTAANKQPPDPHWHYTLGAGSFRVLVAILILSFSRAIGKLLEKDLNG
jgi:hypothetical protein